MFVWTESLIVPIAAGWNSVKKSLYLSSNITIYDIDEPIAVNIL